MNFGRLGIFGGLTTLMALGVVTACSSSSKHGGETTVDSGKADVVTTGDGGKGSETSSPSDGGTTDSTTSDSSITDQDSGTEQDSSTIVDSGTTGNCTINPGTYTVINTAAGDGGIGCPPPNYMTTYPPPASDAGPVEAGPPTDSGVSCTTTNNGTCSTTTTCMGMPSPGITTNVSTTETITSGVPSGMISETVLGADGGTLSACSYSFQWELSDGGSDQ